MDDSLHSPIDDRSRTAGASDTPGAASDDPAAVVEMLDAPVSVRARPALRIELILGLLLLLLITGWAGWSWWDGQQKLNAYQAGQRAAAARQWDEARVAYLAAGDYADAADRAVEAGAYIRQRDQDYAAGSALADAGDWPAALQTLRGVRQLQPGYRDSEQLIAEAERQVYSGGIEGVVAWRLEANPPGMYYRAAAGWVWLAGSDMASQIRSIDNYDYLVYDVPAPGVSPATTPGAGPASFSRDDIASWLATRRLMVADLSGETPLLRPLSVTPQQDLGILWAGQGGWLVDLKFDCGPYPYRPIPGIFACNEVFHLSGVDAKPRPVALPNTGWMVAAVAPDGSKTLLADLKPTEQLNHSSDIYVANPDGGDPRLLYSYPGWIESVELSGDGRYALVLYSFQELASSSRPSFRAVVLDTTGARHPYVLAEVHQEFGQPDVGLVVGFLPGARADQVLLVHALSGFATITIVGAQPGGASPRLIWSGETPEGQIYTNTNEAGDLVLCPSFNSACLLLDGKGRQRQLDLTRVNAAWSRAGFILFQQNTYNDAKGGSSSTLHSYRISESGQELDSDVSLYRHSAGDGDERTPFAIGRNMLAYIANEELHLRTFDGEIDLEMEPGMVELYDPHLDGSTRHFYFSR